MRMRNALAGVVWLVVSAGAVGPLPPVLADPSSGAVTGPVGPPSAPHLVNLAGAVMPRLSPDGTRVAFVLADSLDPTLRQIAMAVTEEGIRPRPLTAGGRSADNPRWTPDGTRLLFLTAATDTALPQIRIIDPVGGESRALTGEPRGVADMHVSPDSRLLAYLVPGPLKPGGDPIDPMVRPPGTKLRWRELDGTKTTTLSPDTANVWRFAWAPDNRRIAALYTLPGTFGEWRRGMLAIADIESGAWRRVPGLWDPNNDVAWSPGGDSLAAYQLAASNLAYPVLHVMPVDDLETKPPVRITPAEARVTERGAVWTTGGGLVVAAWEGVRTFLTRVNPATGTRTRLAECWTELGTDFSMNDAGVLAWISGGLDGPVDLYARFPGDTAPRRLSILNPQLAERRWPAPEVVTWPSTDGLTIEGILFTPGPEYPRPVPMVVMPHGGPSWHYSLGFYADCHNPARYLAERGYAVLLPNPRGSTGYGERFNAMNRGDLGGGDFADILAGVDSLVAAGLVDGNRLGIDGYSYGGFMAAWAVARSDRFRCAVIGAGPMDFLSDYAENDLSPWWQAEFLGAPPWGDPQLYLDHSPITYVNGITEPVLIVHGAEDIRVPLAQSRALAAALRDLDRPFEFRVYPREKHGMAEPLHQVDFMERQLTFFEKHLGKPRRLDPPRDETPGGDGLSPH